ncbi:hypothetical protein CRUP_035198 [Coryphaenoides rupestris]|nr:hypothetical protein CRUP_035198 [Coryphaenoides rupestris]
MQQLKHMNSPPPNTISATFDHRKGKLISGRMQGARRQSPVPTTTSSPKVHQLRHQPYLRTLPGAGPGPLTGPGAKALCQHEEEEEEEGGLSAPFIWEQGGGRGPPRVSEHVAHRQSVRLGRTLKLTCPVEGDPPPLIMWTKDGRNIHSGWSRFRVLQHALRVKDVETDDAGTYVCKATNGFGSVNINYTLIVIGESRAHAPRGFPAAGQRATAVVIFRCQGLSMRRNGSSVIGQQNIQANRTTAWAPPDPRTPPDGPTLCWLRAEWNGTRVVVPSVYRTEEEEDGGGERRTTSSPAPPPAALLLADCHNRGACPGRPASAAAVAAAAAFLLAERPKLWREAAFEAHLTFRHCGALHSTLGKQQLQITPGSAPIDALRMDKGSGGEAGALSQTLEPDRRSVRPEARRFISVFAPLRPSGVFSNGRQFVKAFGLAACSQTDDSS